MRPDGDARHPAGAPGRQHGGWPRDGGGLGKGQSRADRRHLGTKGPAGARVPRRPEDDLRGHGGRGHEGRTGRAVLDLPDVLEFKAPGRRSCRGAGRRQCSGADSTRLEPGRPSLSQVGPARGSILAMRDDHDIGNETTPDGEFI